MGRSSSSLPSSSKDQEARLPKVGYGRLMTHWLKKSWRIFACLNWMVDGLVGCIASLASWHIGKNAQIALLKNPSPKQSHIPHSLENFRWISMPQCHQPSASDRALPKAKATVLKSHDPSYLSVNPGPTGPWAFDHLSHLLYICSWWNYVELGVGLGDVGLSHSFRPVPLWGNSSGHLMGFSRRSIPPAPAGVDRHLTP